MALPYDDPYNEAGRGKRRIFGDYTSQIVRAIIAVAVVLGLITLWASCGTVKQDEVGFKVGGGLIDPAKNKIKGTMLSSGRHLLGLYDGIWTFPSYRAQRYQDYEVTATTKDGKQVTLSGQLLFRFVGEKNPRLAREFATGIGARKYQGHRPGESDEGWTNFVEVRVKPLISSTFAEVIGTVYCADFAPACRSIDPRNNVPDARPDAVYDQVAAALQRRVQDKLGGAYLQDFQLQVNQPKLPADVQDNINAVVREQAKTKAAQQQQKTAAAEAETIRIKASAYKKNPNAIALDIAKECSNRCNMIIDASGRGVKPTVNAGR